jgi:GT2 family glycosyltransferase
MNGLAATAIVVTYNSEAHIHACITALIDAGLSIEVVDNASADDTASLVAQCFPDVGLTINQVNRGFAAAVNQGLAAATTDIVVLVNPDCLVPAATARALITTLRVQPEVGVVGPRLLDPHGNVAISAHPFESWITVLASRFGGSLVPVWVRRLLCGGTRRRTYDACRGIGSPVAVDWLSGACLAVRTTLMRQVGGLDEGYFMYYEDEELCLQAWRSGARVLYVSAVEATHIGGASSADPSWIWPHLYRSQLRFFARHRPSTYRLVRALLLLRAVLGIGIAKVRQPIRPARENPRMRAWAQIAQIALSATSTTIEGPSCTS